MTAAAASPEVTFNWGKDCSCKVRHWGREMKLCQHCGGLTYLRGFDSRPAHKVCAERLATAELAASQGRVSGGVRGAD